MSDSESCSTDLLAECAQEMGITEDAVVRRVLISVDGRIDYRKKLSPEGVDRWLRKALNSALRRKEFVPSSSPLPLNYYEGEW